MIGFYILMIVLGVGPWLGMIGAIAFGLTSNQLILFEAGHVSKILAISFFAITLAGMVLAYRRKLIAGGVLFSVGLAAQLFGNHVQMTYYLFLCMSIYFIILLLSAYRDRQWKPFLKATGVLFLGALLAISSSTSNLWTTYEYSKDTMRGEPILDLKGGQPKSSSETDGLEWQYAMQWSNGGLDLLAGLIPGIAGGGSQEPVGVSSASYKDLTSKGVQLGEKFRLPLYWGDLPFTSGPVYFGAGILFLFILGLIIVKGPLKWWLGFAVLLTLILSMGKNFGWLNELIFNNLPLYNKFRAPSSILSVTSFLIPILSTLALSDVMKKKVNDELFMKGIKISLGIVGTFCLFFIVLGPSIFDFSNPGDVRLGQSGYNLDALVSDRKSLMRKDAIRSLVIILCFAGLIWFYLKGKLKKSVVLAGIACITIIDLWSIGKRYLDADDFIEERQAEREYIPRPVDTQIMELEDNRGDYRVLDLSISTFNSSATSYFHNTIGGYHAAKLQRIQDVIDHHINQNNIAVLNMLNCKYIISADQQLQINRQALGNAWFVEGIRMVSTANEEIDALTNFDPRAQAIIHEEFSPIVSGFDPVKSGSIELVSYEPDHLVYSSSARGDQLAVFSEIWYGPDKGWQAYLDGQPVDHIRANYLLRALSVPSGQHKIEFIFKPRSYYTGRNISMVGSLIILVGLLGLIFIGFKNGMRALPRIQEKEMNIPAKKSKIGKQKKRRK
jgi:hypothetical protein